MTPDEINIAIAEACGWKEIEKSSKYGNWQGVAPQLRGFILLEIPDYYSSLDDMHEAEKVLDGYAWSDYIIELGGMSIDPDREEWKQGCHATAAQRAEAFLRTLNLWKD